MICDRCKEDYEKVFCIPYVHKHFIDYHICRECSMSFHKAIELFTRNFLSEGGRKVKWDGDPLKYEKYLMMEGIIKFSQTCEGKEFGEISIKNLTDFIDKFFDKWVGREVGFAIDNEENHEN